VTPCHLYGWRTDGIADTNLPAWIENPASPLGQIRTFLSMAEPHDFDKAAASARQERDEAIEAARTKLSGQTLTAFNELLAVNEVANFAWWNEDHNFYIDLRASIPLRRAALALAAACGADVFDDGLFLFFPEAIDVCAGRLAWKHLQSLATARRQYCDHYNEIRPTLPKVVGTLPDKVDDPALIEIFGLHHQFFSRAAGAR
jgi:pyruvate, water dikinase